MKKLIITTALVILFSMLVCFQWDMNTRICRAYSDEGQIGALDLIQ